MLLILFSRRQSAPQKFRRVLIHRRKFRRVFFVIRMEKAVRYNKTPSSSILYVVSIPLHPDDQKSQHPSQCPTHHFSHAALFGGEVDYGLKSSKSITERTSPYQSKETFTTSPSKSIGERQ